jgi:hypothetical protein
MPHVYVHSKKNGLPDGLQGLNQSEKSYVLHFIFVGASLTVKNEQLEAFKGKHVKHSRTPQVLVLVLDPPEDESYGSVWKRLVLQLDCKSIVLTHFVSQEEYLELQVEDVQKLFNKCTTLRESAIQLSGYLQQKEMLWAQINASKRVTTAKELVSAPFSFLSLLFF